MIREEAITNDDECVQRLQALRNHIPRNDDRRCPTLARRIEREARHEIGVLVPANAWRRKIERKKMAAGAKLDLEIRRFADKETFDHVVLPQVRDAGSDRRG